MTRIDDAVDQVLKKEPHLTRAEAIKVVIEKHEKNRIKKQSEAKIKRAKKEGRKVNQLRAVSRLYLVVQFHLDERLVNNALLTDNYFTASRFQSFRKA